MDPADRERLVRIETLLNERCAACQRVQCEHSEAIAELLEAEQRRKGGLLMLTSLMALAGAVGGFVAKFFPAGRG